MFNALIGKYKCLIVRYWCRKVSVSRISLKYKIADNRISTEHKTVFQPEGNQLKLLQTFYSLHNRKCHQYYVTVFSDDIVIIEKEYCFKVGQSIGRQAQ